RQLRPRRQGPRERGAQADEKFPACAHSITSSARAPSTVGSFTSKVGLRMNAEFERRFGKDRSPPFCDSQPNSVKRIKPPLSRRAQRIFAAPNLIEIWLLRYGSKFSTSAMLIA